MSIQNDIKTSQSDLRTISTLLGDALSQFAKLFQNEIDLAKVELGEKAQQVGGALGFFAAGAILVIPAAGYGAVRTFGGIDGGRMVPAVILPYLRDCGWGDCGRSICDWH